MYGTSALSAFDCETEHNAFSDFFKRGIIAGSYDAMPDFADNSVIGNYHYVHFLSLFFFRLGSTTKKTYYKDYYTVV